MGLAALSAGLVMGGRAHAQLVDQYFPAALPGYGSDLTLPMPQYDPRVAQGKGIEIGDFNLQPVLSESAGYNSNPLGDGSRGSSLLQTDASVSLGSDWERDALDGSFSVDNQSYLDRPIASQTNWTTSVGGTVDVGRSAVDIAYSHLAENLGPTDLGVLGVTAPVPYEDDDVRLDDNLPFGRFRLVPAFEFQNLTFGQAVGPVTVDYSSLDHQLFSGTLTGLYELSTGRSVVAIIRGTSAQYGNAGAGGSESNYGDVLGLTGIDFETNALIRLRALVGGESRTFNLAGSQAITSPAAELDVIYEPTRLTTVTTSISRELADASSPFSGSEEITEGRFEVAHALRRNVELSAYVDVGSSGFQTTPTGDLGTNQLQTNFGASAAWTLNRHVSLSLTYNYNQSSYSGTLVRGNGSALVAPNSFVGSSDTINTVSLGLTFSE